MEEIIDIKQLAKKVGEKYNMAYIRIMPDLSGAICDWKQNSIYSFDSLDELRTHLNS